MPVIVPARSSAPSRRSRCRRSRLRWRRRCSRRASAERRGRMPIGMSSASRRSACDGWPNDDAKQRARGQRAHEQVVLPPRELVAGVEHEARRADRRHPEHARVVHARRANTACRRRACRCSCGPSTRAASRSCGRAQDVDLVAAHRTDLRLPQFAGLGMNRQAVAVAMTVGEDLRLGAGAADERIVRRHRAVVAAGAASCRRGCRAPAPSCAGCCHRTVRTGCARCSRCDRDRRP